LSKNWIADLMQEKWPESGIPNYRITTDNLLSALVRQYLFSGLYRALAESLASENASRLAAMQAAEKNIEEQLDRFTSEYNHERQESITSELLDMVAGYEALTKNKDKEEEEDNDADALLNTN
jgi:F-type H+-transporting ATPase subunit gamma